MNAVVRDRGRRGLCGALTLACALAAPGCATVPRSDLQAIDIEVVTPVGVKLQAARCETVAARGEWVAQSQVLGGRGKRALVGSGIGLGLGSVFGALDDAAQPDNQFCCKGLGVWVGAILGTVLGAAAGAGSADPRHAYPARLRVVMQAFSPAH